MKKQNLSLGLIVLVSLVYFIFPKLDLDPEKGKNQARLEQLFETKSSGEMVQIHAMVIKLLADDLVGDKHQKFLVRANNHTLLIAHNIDLAERVPIKPSDTVEIYGEYEWNDKGGVIHWTHHDPKNRHPHGWIKHNNKTYQ